MTSTTTSRRPARHLALLGGLLLVAAACGPTNQSPSPAPTTTTPPATSSPTAASPAPSSSTSADVDAIYDAIEGQVLEIRGLDPADVKRETIDADTLRQMNAESFDEDNPPDYVAGQERLYKALGLMSEDASLRDTFLALVDSQVAGFYRPDAKTLYVVSRTGTVNGADKITFAHEYDHALQDANFPVFDDPEQYLDETDEALARAAIYEGDATILMSFWAIPNLTQAEIGDVVAAGSDPASTEILARTPAILRENLLFPYNAGVAALTPVQATGGWAAMDAVFGDMPTSTEQILHPDKFESREAPIDVTITDGLAADLGAGWTEQVQDTLGEFQLRTWLTETGVPVATATAAAEGWGGDRVAVLANASGAWAVALRTAWDTEDDAREFASAAASAVGAAGGPGEVLPGEGGTTRWVVIASDDDTLGAVSGALGLAG